MNPTIIYTIAGIVIFLLILINFKMWVTLTEIREKLNTIIDQQKQNNHQPKVDQQK